MSSRDCAIPLLLLTHFTAGALSVFFSLSQPSMFLAVLWAITFCQAGLLGMWSGLSMTHWGIRLVGVVCGAVFLGIEMGFGMGQVDPIRFTLVVLFAMLIAAFSLAVRLLKSAVICRVNARADTNTDPQFSTRQLMLLTFAIAVLLAAGKLIVTASPFYVSGSQFLDVMSQVVILVVCLLAVSSTAIWVILGRPNPAFRSVLVVVVTVSAGFVCGNFVRGDTIFWLSVIGLQALLLVASLCAVRIGGYRLVVETPTHFPLPPTS
jgi:hypothetical protein